MKSETKKGSPVLHPLTMLARMGHPASTEGDALPDAGLSAALKNALGAKPGEAHLPGQSTAGGRLVAKQAQEARSNAAPKSSPRQQIRPRSGHR